VEILYNKMAQYRFKNMSITATHYPRGSKEKSPSAIDLCFSKGEISNSIDTWMINHGSTLDYSIIGKGLLEQG
jgi:hypothetical protein